MKSLKTLFFAKSLIAAAIATGGISAPVVSHAIAAGGPAGGMICRAGYTGAFDGSRFKCSKVTVISVALECNDPRFPNLVVRAQGSRGTPDGRDVCTRNGIVVTSTDDITGLTRGSDYGFTQVNDAAVATRINNQDQNEASALGLSATDVDTVSLAPAIIINGAVGSRDNANVMLTHFTFPVVSGGPIVVGSPTTQPSGGGLPPLPATPTGTQTLPLRR